MSSNDAHDAESGAELEKNNCRLHGLGVPGYFVKVACPSNFKIPLLSGLVELVGHLLTNVQEKIHHNLFGISEKSWREINVNTSPQLSQYDVVVGRHL